MPIVRAKWWQKNDRWVWAYIIGLGVAAQVSVRVLTAPQLRFLSWHFCYSAAWLLFCSRWMSPKFALAGAIAIQCLWNANELFAGGWPGFFVGSSGSRADPLALLLAIVFGAMLGIVVLTNPRKSFWYRQLGVRAQRDAAPMPVLPESVPAELDPDDVPETPRIHVEPDD